MKSSQEEEKKIESSTILFLFYSNRVVIELNKEYFQPRLRTACNVLEKNTK